LARRRLMCSSAMNLSGKETDAVMQVVADWWSKELAECKSWGAVE
jgi:hypothetical protein